MLTIKRSKISNYLLIVSIIFGMGGLLFWLYQRQIAVEAPLSFWANVYTPGSNIWLLPNNDHVVTADVVEEVTGFVTEASFTDSLLNLTLIDRGTILPILAGNSVEDLDFTQISIDDEIQTISLNIPLRFIQNSISQYDSYSRYAGYKLLKPEELTEELLERKFVILEISKDMGGEYAYISNLVITSEI